MRNGTLTCTPAFSALSSARSQLRLLILERIGGGVNGAQETERLTKEAPPGISAKPHEDNLRYFEVVVAGPQQSPYEGTPRQARLFLSARSESAPTR